METQQKHLEKELRCAKERLEDNYRKQMDLNEKCLEVCILCVIIMYVRIIMPYVFCN